MEKFSSSGGMLPEQIWDRADLPAEEMYFGRSAGSAQPLVWAHAEYLKLLRSVADNQVFDCISVVHDRYILGQHREHFRRYLGIFQLGTTHLRDRAGRRASHCGCGAVRRRVYDRQLGRPRINWTLNRWAIGCFADIPIAAGQTGSIVFTLHWPEQDRWLGRNYEVVVHAIPPAQQSLTEKPRV